MMDMLFIPENVPSSKNTKQWTGKRLISNKSVTKWKKETSNYWEEYKPLFLEMIQNKELPLRIGFHFVRKTRHKFDQINPLQTIQDEMVKYGWIEDDNITILIPEPLLVDGTYFTYDPDNPGVYIKVL